MRSYVQVFAVPIDYPLTTHRLHTYYFLLKKIDYWIMQFESFHRFLDSSRIFWNIPVASKYAIVKTIEQFKQVLNFSNCWQMHLRWKWWVSQHSSLNPDYTLKISVTVHASRLLVTFPLALGWALNHQIDTKEARLCRNIILDTRKNISPMVIWGS